jgi:hypothetical protein
MNKCFELSSKKYKNGRRKFTAVLYKLQPPESVIDGVGTQYNKNGLTFLEEYSSAQLESIKDMSVTVSFLDEERTQILDHGFTEMNTKDGLPTFDNATTVGHFTKGYIDDVEINGEMVRCVLGDGFLDEMRYHAFIEKLDEDLANGDSIEGSIEIYRDEDHETIVYANGYRDKGRIPQYFIHSGWSMVMNPADTNSQLLELNENQNKEEKNEMDENKIIEVIQKAITETNSVKADSEAKIAELNTQIEAKDAEIKELNEVKSVAEATATEKDGKIAELQAENEKLKEEVADFKKKELNSAFDEKLSVYTDEQKACVESEINSYKENPMDGDADAIISKICVNIVAKQMEDAKVAEQNSAKEDDKVDIFSEVNSAEEEEDEDINIF